MKPVLVLALGNAFAGDDGVACEAAALLEKSPDVAALADVHCAGTDLLRTAGLMRGRRLLVIIDAVLSGTGGADVQVCAHSELHGDAAGGAHALDPVAALALLHAVDPAIAAVPTYWVLIGVSSVRLGPGLSEPTAALLPDAVARAAALVRSVGAAAPVGSVPIVVGGAVSEARGDA